MHLFTQKKIRYQQLSSADRESHESIQPRGAATTWRSGIGALAATLLMLNVIAASPMIYQQWNISRHRLEALQSCGTSWEEAKALECRYSIMMNAWLPQPCFDEELNAEFEAAADWPFWADANRTRPLTPPEVSIRTDRVWTNIEYYYTQCAFSFRKLQRAIENNLKVEVDIAEMKHATRCGDFMIATAQYIEDSRDFSIKDAGRKIDWLYVTFPSCTSPTKAYVGEH